MSNVAHKCQPLHHSKPSCSLPVQKARSVRIGAQELQARKPGAWSTSSLAGCLVPPWPGREPMAHTGNSVFKNEKFRRVSNVYLIFRPQRRTPKIYVKGVNKWLMNQWVNSFIQQFLKLWNLIINAHDVLCLLETLRNCTDQYTPCLIHTKLSMKMNMRKSCLSLFLFPIPISKHLLLKGPHIFISKAKSSIN